MCIVSKNILDKIEDINSPEEFKRLYNSFKSSNADLELKEAAIKELKRRKNCFDFETIDTPSSVLKDIEAGAADIDDIGGMN